MYIDIVPNRNSRPAILLRQTKRKGRKTVKETIANLTECSPEVIAGLRLLLAGKTLVPAEDALFVERSIPHGHVQVVLGIMRQLGMDTLLASRPCPERNLVLAMMAQHILEPTSKLATTRLWNTTTLAQELSVTDVHVNELYDALDWLLERQQRIENKLAKRHLAQGAIVLFDVSSSSYHGKTCSLAVRGYNRDGEKLPSIVYGLLTDSEGRPVSVDVYPGNTSDPLTVPDQVEKLRQRFGLVRIVMVGDRGMLTQTQIDHLKQFPQLGWISALRFSAIRKLAAQQAFQTTLFDKQNLAEITSADYPGERLVVCYNPLLAQDSRHTRLELLAATEEQLQGIVAQIARRVKTPLSEQEIAVKVGKIINRYKVGKHFEITIQDNALHYERKEQAIEEESRLDGFYIIRTSESQEVLTAQNVVRTYKSLGQVEQAFRCIKSIDINVRPILHRNEEHVKAHIFLCMLAYYVVWHLRKSLAPILFEDEETVRMRWERDPVDKAQSSQSAKEKKSARETPEGWPVHSLKTLWAALATRCKNTIRLGQGNNAVSFTQLTEQDDFQRHVFELLALKP